MERWWSWFAFAILLAATACTNNSQNIQEYKEQNGAPATSGGAGQDSVFVSQKDKTDPEIAITQYEQDGKLVNEYTITCKLERHQVRITTKFTDLYLAEGDSNKKNPIVLEQYLEYFEGGKLLKKEVLPFRKENQELSGGGQTGVFDCVLSKVQHIDNNGFKGYSFYGGPSSLLGNSEFFGISSLDGDWQWYYYGTMNEKYRELGNYESTLEKTGLEKISYKKHIQVYPPHRAGKIK